MKLAVSVILLITALYFLTCAREYSCENCREEVKDTIPNELISNFSIYISDESQIKIIYPQVKTKLWPGHHWIFDSIQMDGSNQYDRYYDLKKYLEMSKYKIGDSFFVRYEIRWKFLPPEEVQEDTLVY